LLGETGGSSTPKPASGHYLASVAFSPRPNGLSTGAALAQELIKGDTLDELLKRHADSAEGRGQLMAAFE
jgi:hypothetical protein